MKGNEYLIDIHSHIAGRTHEMLYSPFDKNSLF